MKPEISVIVPAYHARRTIETCLRSLAAQEDRDAFEVTLVESSEDGTAGIVEASFPWVRLLRSRDRLFPGAARNRGIAVSEGRIIACLDADCEVGPDWIEALRRAHDCDDPAIGGAIDNAPRSSDIGWAYYFAEFSQWMPGLPPGWMDSVPSAAVSYKRTTLERFGPFVEGTYGSDIELHWRMRRAGVPIRFEPSIVVAHHYHDTIAGFVRHEWEHARQFSRTRVRALGFGPWRRGAMLALAPVVPLKMLAVIASRVVRSGRFLSPFLRSLPMLVLGLTAWAAGDTQGLLGAAGPSHD